MPLPGCRLEGVRCLEEYDEASCDVVRDVRHELPAVCPGKENRLITSSGFETDTNLPTDSAEDPFFVVASMGGDPLAKEASGLYSTKLAHELDTRVFMVRAASQIWQENPQVRCHPTPALALAGVGLLAVLLHSLIDIPFRSPGILYAWLAVCGVAPHAVPRGLAGQPPSDNLPKQ
jgi:hypothetical protein